MLLQIKDLHLWATSLSTDVNLWGNWLQRQRKTVYKLAGWLCFPWQLTTMSEEVGQLIIYISLVNTFCRLLKSTQEVWRLSYTLTDPTCPFLGKELSCSVPCDNFVSIIWHYIYKLTLSNANKMMLFLCSTCRLDPSLVVDADSPSFEHSLFNLLDLADWTSKEFMVPKRTVDHSLLPAWHPPFEQSFKML